MMKEETHIFKGMKRDVHQIRQDGKFLWDAHNIRLTNREDNTLLSITNEKGTSEPLSYFLESYVGHCVLGKYLVVFTANETSGYSYIYRVEKVDDTYNSVILYEGNLNLSPKHPIEALGIYETEFVQKVYWVDGVNQPRVINIVKEDPNYINTSFDFVSTLKLAEEVEVTSLFGVGSFSPGVIQYAFSYYNKFGQESNIFYTTHLNYIGFNDRGGSPEEIVPCSFKINIYNPDTNFEFLRIYSIHRTSLDAIPAVKIVANLPIDVNNSSEDYTLSFTDTGTVGELVGDPTLLFYIGGKDIIASTLCQSSNTLFLGSISIKSNEDWINTKEEVHNSISAHIAIYKDYDFNIAKEESGIGGYYNYTRHPEVAGFKAGETYRIGVQLQNKTGEWSDPVFITDTVLNYEYPNTKGTAAIRPLTGLVIPKDLVQYLLDKEYVKIRPCVVFPTHLDKTIIAQGVLCPTVYGSEMRRYNYPYVISSWFFRPQTSSISGDPNESLIMNGGTIQANHNYALYSGPSKGSEIQGMLYDPENPITTVDKLTNDNYERNYFFVDSNVVTFHSPDIEFDPSLKYTLENNSFELSILGSITMGSVIGDIDIQTSSPAAGIYAEGFYHKMLGYPNSDSTDVIYKNGGLVAGGFYRDALVREDGTSTKAYSYFNMVYPWHRSGSLNNSSKIDNGENEKARSAVLSKKKISNLKFFTEFTPADAPIIIPVKTPQLFSSNEVSLTKVWVNHLGKYVPYYGNVDTLITPPAEGYPLYDSLGFKEPMKEITEQHDDNTEKLLIKRSSDPVRMKYKSTPHIVMSLTGKDPSTIEILPIRGDSTNLDGTAYQIPEWDEVSNIGDPEDTGDSDYPELVKIVDTVRTEALEDQVGKYAYQTGGIYPKSFMRATYEGASQSTKGWSYLAAKDSITEDTIFKVVGDGNSCMIQSGNGIIETEKEGFSHYKGRTRYFKVSNIETNPDNNIITGDLEETVAPLFPNRAPGDINYTISQKHLDTDTSERAPYLLLAELRRTNIINRFGGTSEEALRANLWIPAGEPERLDSSEDVIVVYRYGDTWYSRYDCLKTYPFTQEDENSIIEIGSFMVETRINIDGRYDRNRGQLSNLNMNPTNFNILNEVYSQKNNFFNYRILEDDYYKADTNIPQITWTKEKFKGEEIDTWTNITLANTLDFIGHQGIITSLKVWNENILCFQERGLSQILFNSRVQIPVTDGVPIEISNGYKVDGSRSLSDIIGCTNKWSIATTPYGVYFIDTNTQSIYLYNGQLANLSKDKGMDWWVKSNNPANIWSASKSSISDYGIRTFYDSTYGDVYFTPGYVDNIQPEALCYSETLGQFTSLMSYGGVLAMFNLEGQSYSLYQDLANRGTLSLYKNFEGDYNYFFNKYKGWSFSFITNENPTYTKVFDTIDLRTDLYNEKGDLKNSCPINFLRISNEYQDSSQITVDAKNMRKKFRIWRGVIPRNSGTRERIRNPWAKITLGYNPAPDASNNNKAIVHDITVHYTI